MDDNSDSDSESTQESLNTHEVTMIADEYLIKINKEYDKTVAEQKTFINMSPSKIRNNYNTFYRLLEIKDQNINDEKESLDLAIQYLQEGKNKLNEITNIIQNMKQIINDSRSGGRKTKTKTKKNYKKNKNNK